MRVEQMTKRVFIFGAGFSKPAGMPLASELLPLLEAELDWDEMREWLAGMRERLDWLSGGTGDDSSFRLNIEQVFHYGHFDAEVHRLRQHLAPVGRGDDPGTPWIHAESVDGWLLNLEETLRDVILAQDTAADLSCVSRWAQIVGEHDAVLTFNYDTLVERALVQVDKLWNHGTGRDDDQGLGVFKLHGSIDWIVLHRNESSTKLDLLFDKKNSNRSDGKTGHVEDDYRLWRCRTREQLSQWIKGRDLQGELPRKVGTCGLGAYKELHRIPGLGLVWTRGMGALYQADSAIVVGFSMSDFDAMAQMQFAVVARARNVENRPLRVIVIDPFVDQAAEDRFRRVFRSVEFVGEPHEEFDWQSLTRRGY